MGEQVFIVSKHSDLENALAAARDRRNYYASRFVLLEERAYAVLRAMNQKGNVEGAIEDMRVELQRGHREPVEFKDPCGCGFPGCTWDTDYEALVARCPNCCMGTDRSQTYETGKLGCPECGHGEPDHQHTWQTGPTDPEARWCLCGERRALDAVEDTHG